MSEPKTAQGTLRSRVIDQGLCVACGACVGHCPYFTFYRGRVAAPDRCELEQGRCLEVCPVAGPGPGFQGPLGPHARVLAGRATDEAITRRAQYGGVASALLITALEKGLASQAVTSHGHPEDPPRGVRATTREEVIAAAGSRYFGSGSLEMLNQALAEGGNQPLAVVGLPCQMKAVAALKKTSETAEKRVRFSLGLFCTWALDYAGLSKYLRFMLMGERALGYDIPPPPAEVFKVRTSDGVYAFPLEEIRRFRLPGCARCDDMTATWADISVGALEGLDGFNTLIVRTPAGEELLDLAAGLGLVTTRNLPEADLAHLAKAAQAKKDRARAAWEGA